MAFVKKDWKDRIAEFINRRRLTYEDGRTELVEVARDEGTVSQEGDAFIAETMNDLEERIEKALTPLNTMEEIEANTQDDQLAGALAVKALRESVSTANKNYGYIGNVDLFEWALSQTVGGTFATVSGTVTNVPEGLFYTYASGILSVENNDRAIIIYRGTKLFTIKTGGGSFDGCEWYDFASMRDLINYLPLSGGTMSGDLRIGKLEDGTHTLVNVSNKKRSFGLIVDANGNAGLYDNTTQSWTLVSNLEGVVSFGRKVVFNDSILPRCIELTSTGSANGGYIDFHYGGADTDYTSRIMESEEGWISVVAPKGMGVNGQKVLTVNKLTVSGTKLTINLD